MKKINFNIISILHYILAFFIPIFLLSFCYFIVKIYPFGDKTLLVGDLSGQYTAFLSYFKEIIIDGVSPYYTFSKVLGGEMVGFGAYYIYSPFNFILIFFDTVHLPIAILLITIIKIGTCGFTMFYYLKHRTISSSQKWFSLMFSTCYSLMAYNIAYQQNIMWLDGVLLLPLIILGLEKLIDSKKWISYCLFLAMALAFNYYTGYMLCLFVALYFLYYVFSQRKFVKITIITFLRFMCSSLLAAGLSAIVLLPTAYSLQGGKASFNLSDILNFSWNLPFIEFFKYLLPGTFHGKNPNIYCGTLILLLVLFYFARKKMGWGQKLGKLSFLLLMIFSMLFAGPDRLWHATAVPAGFPYRYSFLLSFLLIQIAYEYFCSISITQIKKYKNIILFGVLFCFVELTVNAALTLKTFGYEDYSEHTAKAAYLEETISSIQQRDPSFYRIENLQKHSLNDAMHFQYNGLTSYSSSEQTVTKEFAGKMGLNDLGFWVAYPEVLPASIDSFLNVKYVIQKDSSITTNKNVLPLGILADETLYQVEMYKDKSIVDVFQIQNQLWNSLVEKDQNTFDMITAEELLREENSVEYQFVVERETPIYTNVQNNMLDTMQIYQNGTLINEISAEKQIYSLGTFQPGDMIRVKINSRQNIDWYDLFFYYENLDVVVGNVKEIKTHAYDLEEFNTNYLRGKVTNKKEDYQYLLFTIPYDKGWEIFVDGVKTEGLLAMDCLISVPIASGEHEVILHFLPKGLKAGLSISIASFMLLALFSVCNRKYSNPSSASY